MAKGQTMWVAEDGKVFPTQKEAEAHEFAQNMLRRASSSSKSSGGYMILKELHESGWILSKDEHQARILKEQ